MKNSAGQYQSVPKQTGHLDASPHTDKERRECGQHRRGAGQPHPGSHPGWRRQLLRSPDRATAGHPGCSTAGPEDGNQGDAPTKLQQLQQGANHLYLLGISPGFFKAGLTPCLTGIQEQLRVVGVFGFFFPVVFFSFFLFSLGYFITPYNCSLSFLPRSSRGESGPVGPTFR